MPEKNGSQSALSEGVCGYNLPMLTKIRHRVSGLIVLSLLLAAGCRPAGELVPTEAMPPVFTPTVAASPTAALTTLTPSPSAVPTLQPQTEICSPLAGYELGQLAGQISNPYNPPPPGSDDPHYGVDLADFSLPERIARGGMPVQAVLSGRVAGVIVNRFPYGNALIVETLLRELNDPILMRLNLPQPPADVIQPLALTCPPYPLPEDWQTRPRSLYVMYAHLQDVPALKAGDVVTCGQVIGAVGDSGNALVPHLHLEARVGPAEMNFTSMAHYDPSATSEEMAVYCLWRVSGLFQSMDAMCLLDECSTRP